MVSGLWGWLLQDLRKPGKIVEGKIKFLRGLFDSIVVILLQDLLLVSMEAWLLLRTALICLHVDGGSLGKGSMDVRHCWLLETRLIVLIRLMPREYLRNSESK